MLTCMPAPGLHPCRQLSDTSLSGTLPADGWDALTSLSSLYVFNTSLRGQLAATFPDSLETLELFNNSLTGISPAWRPPPRLQKLDLSNNQLSQPLAQQQGWLAAAQGLEVLNLQHNRLSGMLPADLALPLRLTELYLYDNKLSGACAALGRMPALPPVCNA